MNQFNISDGKFSVLAVCILAWWFLAAVLTRWDRLEAQSALPATQDLIRQAIHAEHIEHARKAAADAAKAKPRKVDTGMTFRCDGVSTTCVSDSSATTGGKK